MKCGRIYEDIVKRYEKEAIFAAFERGGDSGSPPERQIAGHFRAAREDRDGRSRYRAGKMLSLQRSRVVPRLWLPLRVRGGFYFC